MLGALLLATAAASASTSVGVSATFVPASRAGVPAAVEVRFTPADPDVHINRFPPPRLDLEPLQGVLKLSPVPAAKPAPEDAKYLGAAEPYRFSVVAKGATAGAQTVKGTVTYFYCSQREGWCRKGSNDVVVSVKLR
ncbi:MAG TPA: hypothetical protein VGL15_14265 [Vicinamibacteria bacterium]|jgi:hypothetical protein